MRKLIFDQDNNPIPTGAEVESATVNRTITEQNQYRNSVCKQACPVDLGSRGNLFSCGRSLR